MLLLLLSIVWVAVIAILLARAITQYGHYQVARPKNSAAPNDAPSVAVVIPARNEAHDLCGCVDRLLSQDYPRDRLSFVIIDDQSIDGTRAIADQIAARDDRVQVIDAEPLPPEWAGKAHACWQAADSAHPSDWLCFIDADTKAQPALIKTAIHEARQRDLGMLSFSPVMELLSPWERLVLPAGFFFIAFTQDVRAMEDPQNMDVHADGQFLLVRRDVYERVGGYAAVKSAVAEDSALARAVKRRGHAVALLGTENLITARMYADLPSLWQGLSRQASTILTGPGLCLAWAIGALLLGWAAVLLPAWAGFNLANEGAAVLTIAALVLASVGSLALLGTHIGAARYFHIPLLYGFLFPLSYTLGAGILFSAARRQSSGQIAWKGRTYNSAAHA